MPQYILDEKDVLRKEDFTNAFKRVVELLLKAQERQEKAIQQLFSEHERLSGDFKSHYTSNLSQLRESVNSLLSNQLKRIDVELKGIEEKNHGSMEEMKRMMSEMIEKKISEMDIGMETMKNILHGETQKKTETQLKIPTYDGKLDTEKAITTFKEEYKKDIQELKDMLTRIQENRSRGGGPVKRYIQRWVNLSASVDGSTTTFTLPKDVVRVQGLLSSQFPQLWVTTDFSFAGGVLTTNFTMQTNASLVAVCEVLFYP